MHHFCATESNEIPRKAFMCVAFMVCDFCKKIIATSPHGRGNCSEPSKRALLRSKATCHTAIKITLAAFLLQHRLSPVP